MTCKRCGDPRVEEDYCVQCAQIREALQGIPGLGNGPLGLLMGPASSHRCHYCVDRRARSWDHIVPRSKGGPDAKENLVPACVPCNQAKADNRGKCRCEKCRTAWQRWSEPVLDNPSD